MKNRFAGVQDYAAAAPLHKATYKVREILLLSIVYNDKKALIATT